MDIILQRLALAGYAIATLLAFTSMAMRRKVILVLAPVFAGLGFLAHVGGFAREIGSPQGLPIFAIDHVISFLAMVAVAIYLYSFIRYHSHVLGMVMLPLALILFLFSGWMPLEAVEVSSHLSQPLLWLHIVISTMGVGALSLTFTFSIMYLIQEKTLKEKRPSRFFLPLPSLTTCDQVLYRSLRVGFALLTVGLVLAGVWSANERETYQIWQSQRELLALASWVIFGVVLYARLVSGWRGRKMALLSIAGFLVVMLRIIGGPFL
jgi:ABC-type uncharacterized transport system permease subunit